MTGRRYPDHPRFRALREVIERIVGAVPDEAARREVFCAVYGMMRGYDSYHIIDCKGLDPAFDAVLAGWEPWLAQADLPAEGDQP